MTEEQKQFKDLILADLKVVDDYYLSESKSLKLMAAYHMQQAIEKTIKLKAQLEGLYLWGHDIDVLINKCEEANVDINIPKFIKERADLISHWESECRYYPIKTVRRDSIKKAYDVTLDWLNRGESGE